MDAGCLLALGVAGVLMGAVGAQGAEVPACLWRLAFREGCLQGDTGA
ncbi:MAG TPA: hypothetical protein VF043_01210 [Ktedonobacteraceae bacterium]